MAPFFLAQFLPISNNLHNSHQAFKIPIQVTHEFKPGSVGPFVAKIEASNISIWPQKIPQIPFDYEYPDTTIEELRVFISRPAILAEDGTLPEEQKKTFVCHLIEATQRLVTATKARTKQWDLDIQHPIKWYKYKYFYQDEIVGTCWPLGEGFRKTPGYIVGSVTTDAAGVIGLLSPQSWEQLTEGSINIPEYEERIADARVFKSLMHYEAAILYFAMAAELMVIEATQTLVDEEKIDGGPLYYSNCVPKTRKMMEALAKFDPSLRDKFDPSLRELMGCRELKECFNTLLNWRNELAHGSSLPEADHRVTQALAITSRIKQKLHDWLIRH